MACNSNGQTYVNTCIPASGGTETATTYVLDLTHYNCGNRKVCATGAFPITADLKYQVIGTPKALGNDVYQCDILVSGTCTYMPYRCGQSNNGCQCNPCPVTDNIWTTVSVPVSSADIPTVTAGVCSCEATNLRDCSNVSNAISITTSFLVESTAGGGA